MNRLFGTKKEEAPAPKEQAPPLPPPPSHPTDAPAPKPDLVQQQQRMDGRIKDMEGKIKELDQEMAPLFQQVKNSRGSQQKYLKSRLLNMMKKRKMYEQQIGNYYGAQGALDRITFTNENIQNTIEMADALKEANEIQEKAMKKMDLDELAEIQDKQQELMWNVNEFNEQMNNNYDMDVDEDDLDEELAELENDMALQGMMGKDYSQQSQQQQMKDPFLNN